VLTWSRLGKIYDSAAQRRSLEEAIVDTVREPLIVLDDALRIVGRKPILLSAFNPYPTGNGRGGFYTS